MKFNCTYSTLDSSELLDMVKAEYDIETPLECVFWERGANDTYKVHCADKLYYLRVFRSGAFTRDANEFEAEGLNYLHLQGYPVAFPIVRKSGEYTCEIAAPEGLRYALLMSEAKGAVPDFKVLDNNRVVGESIAQLHLAANGFETSRKRNHLDLQWLLEDSIAVINVHMQKHAKALQLVEEIAKEVRAAVSAAPEDSLDYGLCHGDFHGGNLHIHEGKVTHFDFEECAFGFRIYDLATFKWNLGTGERLEKRWPEFLAGYESVRPLTKPEHALMDTFVILRQLAETAYGIRHVKDFGHNGIMASDVNEWCDDLKALQQR